MDTHKIKEKNPSITLKKTINLQGREQEKEEQRGITKTIRKQITK